MKPKKGETNNEMDEPMKNPLQLVKDLVLLIVEARTPDFTVKGRIEGPHCPIIRGRLTHKCSADKVECGRAQDFCCLAQRLWLNSIPVCLDILLFPDCIHGREEASVTEGAVTQVSQENVLLIERWTIDWTKRRQDDCLSSSMLIQAVRSYLHFSQISSWLFSTCGRLPGRLAYRVYAPGEVTSLDFPHPPDIHSFPVCLVSFHPVRVKVSSLQRQASVPILVCHQAKTVGDNSVETLYRDNSQGKRPKVVKTKTKQEHLRQFVPGTCFMGGPWSSDQLQTTDSVTMRYSKSAMTVKGGMKSVKSLHSLDTASPIVYEDQTDDRYGPSYSVRNPFTFTKPGNMFNHFEESDNMQSISSADIAAGKAASLARVMISDGGDDVETTDDIIARMCSIEDISYGSDVDASFNAFSAGTSDLLIKKLKSSHLKREQGLLNQGLTQGSNSKRGYAFLSDKNRESDISGQQRAHMRAANKVGEINLHTKQMRTGFLQNVHERKLDQYLENKDECINPQTDDGPLIFTTSDEVVDCCKFAQHLQVEQPHVQAQLKMLEQANVRALSQNVWGIQGIDSNHGNKWSFSCSQKQFFRDGQSLDQRDKSVSCIETDIKGKLQTRKLSSRSLRETCDDDEKLIETLSDKLLVDIAPSKGTSDLSAELQVSETISGSTTLKGLLQSENREPVSLCDGREELKTKPVKKYLDQNAEFSQLTVDVSKLPDTFEDSDDTPVASPNQPSQSRPVSETFMKLVAAKSMKQNPYWLQKDLSNPPYAETPLESEDVSDTNSDHELSGNHENGYVKEDPLSQISSARSQTPDQSSSRKMFEENLLPLVSYDADSDSFRKVDDFVSCNVLHSPKVLFSCDLPNTKSSSSSQKCIDFSDTFEAEFFRSKMNDLVDPEAIGKYMSKLALLSNTSSNGKENQGYTSDVIVDADQQFHDFITHGATSNGHMSSNTECSPKQKREVHDAQTWTHGTDLQSACNYSLITLDKLSDTIVHDDPSLIVQELSNDNLMECLVNKECFLQTRRQLNYFHPENTDQALTRKTKKHQSVIETPATLALSPVCDKTLEKHQVHTQEEDQSSKLSEISGLNGTLISYPSEKIALQTSPPLSSSCSSSSSSSSISSVQMRSVPPSTPSPTVLAPASTHKTLHSEKHMEEDVSVLGLQEPMFLNCSSLTSDTPSDELVNENPPRTTIRRTLNTEIFQSDFTSNMKSSYNAESTCPHFCASVSVLLVSAIPTSSPSNSASSISVHSPQSSIYLTPQVPNDAIQCPSENIRTPSLFNDPIPQPLPQGNVDLESGSSVYFKSESTSPTDLKLIMPDLTCNQNMNVHYLNSLRISDRNSVQCVPNLFHGQPSYAKHLCDVQMTSQNCVDQKNYIPFSKKHGIESSCYQSVSDCYTRLDTPSAPDTNIDQSSQENNQHPDITQSTHHPLNISRQVDKEDIQAAEIRTTVAKAAISTNNKIAELNSVSLESVTECKTSTSTNIDSSKLRFNSSSIPMPNGDIESLLNEAGSSKSGDLQKNKVYSRSNDECARIAVNLLTTEIISHDSSLSQEQPGPFLKETGTLLQDLAFETASQSEDKYHDVFHLSFVNQPRSTCNSNQETISAEQCSQTCLSGITDQHENMQLHDPSLRVIETGLNSKNGFDVENINKDKDVSDNNWDSDVVFYLSEPETSGKTDQSLSALSHSLKKITSSDTHKAIRPSSLSAEVNLEMKLRSNPGIKDKTDLEFSTHSRSPPFLSDPPGWNSVPPHRTVSTPSGMDRESRMKEERTSANISVIQQQNCDNVSQTGLRRMAAKSASMIFNNRTGLPTQSSPAPLKRKSGGRFEYDVSLINTRAIKNAFSCSKLASSGDNNDDNEEKRKQTLSTSAPASTNCLLGNFEESILNGRIDPVGTVDGFSAEIGASGSFCPKHFHLPVTAFFFALSDDNAPSPYLGYINLESIGKKGYHIPKKGTVQVTLFNPNKMVVKMFVVVYDLSDMPVSSQTFIRQRTVYSPVDKNHPAPSYLRYLIHLRCASSHSGKIYLHTDIRLIFARQKLDIDAKTIPYELKSYTEGPQNPKYSPKK